MSAARTTMLVAIAIAALRCGGDAANPCESDGYLGVLGTVPDGDSCRPCNDDGECQGLYGDKVPEGCVAYCGESYCHRHCPGECSDIPDDGCTPGASACRGGEHVCDPLCGASGGCRRCATDAECELELGDGAICADHCGWCCQPDPGCNCF